MHTGENEQSLRKILDLTRMMSIAVLLIHFYYYCYGVFARWELTSTITDRLLRNIYNTGLFNNVQKSKLIALALLTISLIAGKGKQDEKARFSRLALFIITGILIFFSSYLI